MQDQLINFKTAKLAKEKGFNIKTKYSWYIPDNSKESLERKKPDGLYYISAPTQSLLQKWLREIHNIDTYVISEDNNTYWYALHGDDIHPKHYKLKLEENEDYNSVYEEALEIGLIEALKLIK